MPKQAEKLTPEESEFPRVYLNLSDTFPSPSHTSFDTACAPARVTASFSLFYPKTQVQGSGGFQSSVMMSIWAGMDTAKVFSTTRCPPKYVL